MCPRIKTSKKAEKDKLEAEFLTKNRLEEKEVADPQEKSIVKAKQVAPRKKDISQPVYVGILQNIESFRKEVNHIQATLAYLSDEINNADKALGDLRHLVELHPTNDMKVIRKVYRSIESHSKKRRVAKDAYDILEPIAKWAEQYKTAWQTLDQTMGQVRKKKAQAEQDRVYRPRVLEEMYQELSK